MPEFSDLEIKLKKLLPKERFQHSLRVKEAALKLAQGFSVDKNKVRTAALLHDCSRYLKSPEMVEAAKGFGIKVTKIEEFEPKLLHARLSARIAKRDFGITDKEILTAIEKHTVGHEEMNTLDKIIYLADHIEEGRDFKEVSRLRKLASKDLDRAIAASASSMLRFLIDQELPIFEQTVRTRNYYLMKDKG
jgi:predicted HD superfamily hydrolase involved in NAD metabolism